MNPFPHTPASPASGIPTGRFDMGIAAALSLLVFLLAHGATLPDVFIINDDVRQQIYWMQQWRDPALFRGDWLTDYARCYVSWGVAGLYRLADTIVPPLMFSKILPGLLFAALGAGLYGTGRLLAGRLPGWCLVIGSWYMPFFLFNMAGGLARGFASPLLVWFLFAWLARRPGLVGLTLLLQALFIPYVFLLCAGALVLAWALSRPGWAPAPPFPGRFWHYALFGLCLALALAFNLQMELAGFGPLASAADMAGLPEYAPGGRFHVIPVPSIWFELFCRPFDRMFFFPVAGLAGTVLSILLLGALLLLGWRRSGLSALLRPENPFLWLAGSSLGLYCLARVLVARLFIPSRYLEYPASLAWCLIFGCCLACVLRRWPVPRLALGFALGVALLLAGWRLAGEGLYDYSDNRALSEHMRDTPVHALIAGHPYAMDNVLTFGQRKVFASYELAHPWSLGLWRRLKPRLESLFQAYYAQDPRVVRQFAAEYAIDFMVVDIRDFSPEFLGPHRISVPCSQSPDVPAALRRLCSLLQLDFAIESRLPARWDFPSDHPFFAPFGDQIRALTSGRTSFAMLDETAFPSRRIDSWRRLLDLRTPAAR